MIMLKKCPSIVALLLVSLCLTACGGSSSSNNNSEGTVVGKPLDITINSETLMPVLAKQPELTRAIVEDDGWITFEEINSDYDGIIKVEEKAYGMLTRSAVFRNTTADTLTHVLFYASTKNEMKFEVVCGYSRRFYQYNDSNKEFVIVERIEPGEQCAVWISVSRSKEDQTDEPYHLVITELNQETLGMSQDEYLLQLDVDSAFLASMCPWANHCYKLLEEYKEVEAGEVIRQGNDEAVARPWDGRVFVNFKQGYLKTVDGVKLPFIEANNSHDSFTAELLYEDSQDDQDGKAEAQERTSYSLLINPELAEVSGTFSYLLKIDEMDYKGTPDDESDDYTLEVLYQADDILLSGEILF